MRKIHISHPRFLIGYLTLLIYLNCFNLLYGKTTEKDTCFSKLTDHVNVFIGTSNAANTHPGPVLPWGMVSLSPLNSYDTISHQSGASPYYFGNKYISGFTHLNMSGTGCPDMGTFCLMPTTGNLSLHQPDNTSAYSNEKANPGYYSVDLDKFGIKAELTTTVRTGLSCFTFPKGKSNILLNLGVGLTAQKGGSLKRVSDVEVEGFKSIGNFCGIKCIQTVYFVAKVSKNPVASGVWTDGKDYRDFNREIAGNDIGAYFSFDTEENESIYVKVGVSYVSIKNARANLDAEQPGFDFANTAKAAEFTWNNELSKIQVEGGTRDDKVKFYTALYHTLIHPGLANDVNGEYKIMGSNSIGKSNEHNRYTIFSLWDTYRNVHPFLSLVYPKQQSDMVKSMLSMYQESGWLPKWELAGMETNCMVGDPAIPVIVDSYLRGVKDFDIDLAWEAMTHNASTCGKDNLARPGIDDWLKYGYIPDDAPYTLKLFTTNDFWNEYENVRQLSIVWGSVSTGMEYCIADWNLAQMAKTLGKDEDYKLYFDRSLNYRNSFDSETGFVRPRLKDGSWLSPFDPASKRLNGFVEGSSWNYTFMVPHDMKGLIQLMGGSERFMEKLNLCFEKENFDITNEPDLAYPYLFNYVKSEEWRTQEKVREIVNRNFNASPDGLPGNDDCGTMSTWLMYSMMGFYPDCPGDMDYQITSPVFSKVTIALDPAYYQGKTFIIETKNAKPENHFIRSMELNGKPLNKFTLNHNDIINGKKLLIIEGSKPDR
jgi:predicted alpha-1,2-mannosidase